MEVNSPAVLDDDGCPTGFSAARRGVLQFPATSPGVEEPHACASTACCCVPRSSSSSSRKRRVWCGQERTGQEAPIAAPEIGCCRRELWLYLLADTLPQRHRWDKSRRSKHKASRLLGNLIFDTSSLPIIVRLSSATIGTESTVGWAHSWPQPMPHPRQHAPRLLEGQQQQELLEQQQLCRKRSASAGNCVTWASYLRLWTHWIR